MRARWGGQDRATRPRRRAPWRALSVVVIGGWMAIVALSLVRAKVHADAAADALEEVRHAGWDSDPDDLRAGVAEAGASFDRATGRLDNPAVRAARWVPVVGRQVTSAVKLVDAGSAVASVGERALADLGDRLGRAPAPADRAGFVADVQRVTSEARAELASIDLGPGSWLAPPLAAARETFAADLEELQRALRRAHAGTTGARALLEGPRRYLVFAANNAEMRAGSGMFLSVGVLSAVDGTLRLEGMRSVTEVPVPDGIAVADPDLAGRWGWLHPQREWRNLMLSPRFDAAAPLAASMWEAVGGGPVDGVMAVDPVALGAIARATGPLDVGGRSLGADAIVGELLHDQYARFPVDDQKAERREQLGAVAVAAMAAIDRGEWSIERLGRELAAAARGRHLLVWSRHAPEQRAWAQAGVGGALADDSLLVALQNRAGNKLDQFVDLDVRMSTRPRGDDVEVELAVTVSNRTPAGEPVYVAGPYPGMPFAPAEYFGLLSVNVPGQAKGTRIDGVDRLVAAGADGPTRVVATEVRLAQGETRTFVVRFRVRRGDAVTVVPSARHEPVAWRYGGIRWTDASARVVRWAGV